MKRKLLILLTTLGSLHAMLFLAGFISPYDPRDQNRDYPFVPPTHIHFLDARGNLHLHPFVYQWVSDPSLFRGYRESREREYPIRFFVLGNTYRIGFFSFRTHLIGVDSPAQLFLAGTDNFGRDQFSRVLYGGRISIAAGLLATGISLSLALFLGTAAGFYGRWIDETLMRIAELFLVLPWLYLLFAVRAFLPLHISPAAAFLLLVIVIGAIGWARPARLVRGIVLSAKSRRYVVASRSFGASDAYVLRRHVLPHTYGVLLTQATLLIPQYIVAEVTLSFFGLGLREPEPSWGNLLATLRQYDVLTSYWWMFSPALALVVFSLGYLLLANALHQQLQSTST